MLRIAPGHRLLALVVALVVVSLGLPAFAQSTGSVKGKVVDGQGQPVEGATITIEYADGVTRKFTTKSNRKGEFIQIGLQPGNYQISAEKDKVGYQSFNVRVSMGSARDVNFQLTPASAENRPMSKEDIEKIELFKKTFEAGVEASKAGDQDTAVARFTEASTMQADCYSCIYNVGGAHAQKKDFEKAEEAFKQALAMRPDSPEPYNALANIYNMTRRFDEAAKMTEEATKRAGAGGGAGNPDQLFNQGVIFWNAGKIPDAKKQFEEALKVDPNHAEAHYWVGMANLNEGNLPDAKTHFEEYMRLAPDGQYAAQAKGVLSQLPK